jgi:hypothetical protein
VSICSRHREPKSDCALCQTDIRDALPGYDQMVAEARLAGECKCECGFTFYRTVSACPLCNKTHPVETLKAGK